MYDVNVLTKYGINVNKCLEIFGNIEMYNETLNDFLNSVDSKIEKMSSYVQNNDLNMYAIDVHALKSDAKYLGFNDLAKISSELERACSKNDVQFVNTNHQQLINQVKTSVNIAKYYFGKATPQDVENAMAVAGGGQDSQMPISSVQSSTPTPSVSSVTTPSSVMPQQTADEPTVKINLSGIRPIIKPKLMKDKILIVDDSNLIVKFVIRFLSDDYEVLSASDGAEAIKLLDDPNFRSDLKLCLLDLNMPNVNGYQVLEHCKQHDYYKDLPIAVESGVEDTSSLDKVNSYPIVGILLKPFKESDLKRVVEKSYATYF